MELGKDILLWIILDWAICFLKLYFHHWKENIQIRIPIRLTKLANSELSLKKNNIIAIKNPPNKVSKLITNLFPQFPKKKI